MSHGQLAELRWTIFAKVLWNLVTNKSKAVTAIPGPHKANVTITQQLDL